MGGEQRSPGRFVAALAVGLALVCGLSPLSAQELEPRAYRALPVGLHFGLLVYSF